MEHYLEAAVQLIRLTKSSMEKENFEKIYQEMHAAYIEHLRELARENDYFKHHIEEKINFGGLDDIQIIPMILGVILNEETKRINNIYMMDEMYEQAINWLASMQAQAMANK